MSISWPFDCYQCYGKYIYPSSSPHVVNLHLILLFVHRQASPDKRMYLVILQDLVGPSHRWPRSLRRMVFAQLHLNNTDRFTVIVFLYRNGVNPVIIKEFLSCYNFDTAAWRQIDYVVHALEQGRGWRQWNVALQRSV